MRMRLDNLNYYDSYYFFYFYLTAKEPEQRVAHIPPMVAPGPVCSDFVQIMKIPVTKMRLTNEQAYLTKK